MVEKINKLIRVQRQLLQDLGREPTPEEIAAEMDTTPQKVREILKISQEPASLETPIGEEEDSQLGDFIEDEDAASRSQAVSEMHATRGARRGARHAYAPRAQGHRAAFRLKGRAPAHPRRGRPEFGVTRERIRQIEAKTLAKLKSYHDSQRLRDFLD